MTLWASAYLSCIETFSSDESSPVEEIEVDELEPLQDCIITR